MKISRSSLNKIIENYTQENQLNEFGFLDNVNPAKYVKKLETTIRKIANNKDKNYNPGPAEADQCSQRDNRQQDTARSHARPGKSNQRPQSLFC